jgi:HD-GYP domain-containing protein (c-di-GMP phosphodiesterase class II)
MSRGYMMSINGVAIREGRLPFNIYLRDSKGRMVLYGRQGVEINRNQHVFLIAADDVGSYLDYTFDNVVCLICDSSTPVKVRAGLIQDTSRKIFSKFEKNPLDEKVIGQCKGLARGVLELLIDDPGAHKNLLSIASLDCYLSDHALNCSTFCILMARDLLGDDEELLHAIALGGLLMDVGMVSVDPDLVRKPAHLTDEEYEQVKQHVRFGLESLRTWDLPAVVLDIVRHHHERLDGSGYPDGLRGDEIPLHVRIATVADVYDALTSIRSFRKENRHIDALTMMLSDGDRFDQQVLKVLLDIVIKNEALIKVLIDRHCR